MLFSINNKDYTSYIVADTYKVNVQPVYESYTDAKGKNHNVKITDRVKGTFDMFFRKPSDFATFLSDFKQGKSQATNLHSVALKPNNTNQSEMFDVFLKFDATRMIDGTYTDYFGVFTLEIEGR